MPAETTTPDPTRYHSQPCLACGARGVRQDEESGQFHCIACAYVHLPAKYLARRATPTGERTA